MITTLDRKHVSEGHRGRSERRARETSAAEAVAALPFDATLAREADATVAELGRLEQFALAADAAAFAAVEAFSDTPNASNATNEIVAKKLAQKARAALDGYFSETEELRTRAARQQAVIDHHAHVAAMERSPFLASQERLRRRLCALVTDLSADITSLQCEHGAYREACRIAADLSSQAGVPQSYPVADVPTVVQGISDQLAAEMRGNHPQLAYPIALRVGELSGGGQIVSLQLIAELAKEK